jgi:hypothetical protein
MSLWSGLPMMQAIFERHLGDRHFIERLGNLTQTGMVSISEVEKSKYNPYINYILVLNF